MRIAYYFFLLSCLIFPTTASYSEPTLNNTDEITVFSNNVDSNVISEDNDGVLLKLNNSKSSGVLVVQHQNEEEECNRLLGLDVEYDYNYVVSIEDEQHVLHSENFTQNSIDRLKSVGISLSSLKLSVDSINYKFEEGEEEQFKKCLEIKARSVGIDKETLEILILTSVMKENLDESKKVLEEIKHESLQFFVIALVFTIILGGISIFLGIISLKMAKEKRKIL